MKPGSAIQEFPRVVGDTISWEIPGISIERARAAAASFDDTNDIHYDPVAARAKLIELKHFAPPRDFVIVPGGMIVGIAGGQFGKRFGQAMITGLSELSFLKPTLTDDNLYLEMTLKKSVLDVRRGIHLAEWGVYISTSANHADHLARGGCKTLRTLPRVECKAA